MTFWYHEHLHFLIWGFAIIGYTLLIKVGVATELRSDGVIPCGPIRRCLLIPWISQLFAGSQDLEQGCLKRWLKTQRKRPDQLEFPWNSLRPNKEWSLWWSFSFPRGLSLVFELSGNPLICSHGGWKWSGSGAIMQLIRPKVDQVQRKYKNDQDRFPPICTKKKNPPWILAGNPKSDAPATLWWLWCEPSWWVAASGILHIAVAVGLWSPNGAPGVCPPWFSSPSSLDSIAPFWSSHRSTPNFRSREKTSQSDLIPKPNTGKNKPFEHFKPPQRG